MYQQKAPVRFFLGANTPDGFVGYMRELYDPKDGWIAYLIKSGPGTGKSTLMRRVLELLTVNNIDSELIVCSSDPDSIDGVIAPTLKVGIFDATAPHIMEPRYWGATERIVDLAGCMDTTQLHRQHTAIITSTDACAATHDRCRKFLCAINSVLNDNARMAAECTDIGKVFRTADRIAQKEWGTGDITSGQEHHRFLSAITPQGLVVHYETLQALCPRIYAIEDEHGFVGETFMKRIGERALRAGHSIIRCGCPLSPHTKTEHILIPDAGVGFTVSNSWHKADFPVYRRIHAVRFTDTDKLKAFKQRMQFNRRIAKELMAEAILLAQQAKAQHDVMEDFNTAAMDWTKAEQITADVLTGFQQIIDQQ